ncbi:MAG: hypothetical protein JRF63_13730 [Deltaproteobacteria bacterium]|nr:hypothetical protein [Deltaproteobacteria bacterium]
MVTSQPPNRPADSDWFDRDAIRDLILEGVRSSWLDDDDKLSLATDLKADPSWS